MIFKECNRCNVSKDINCFHKREDSPDGHRNQCKQCKKEVDREYWMVNGERKLAVGIIYKNNNKERTLKKAKEYKENNREQSILNSAKKRALKKGLSFDLELQDIVIPRLCPLLDIELGFNGSMNNRDSSPSIDRIDSSEGYVKGNIRIISYRANRIKNDATPEEIKLIAERIEGYSTKEVKEVRFKSSIVTGKHWQSSWGN